MPRPAIGWGHVRSHYANGFDGGTGYEAVIDRTERDAGDPDAREGDYAASTASEALPELSRMYLQGVRAGNAAAGEAWRNEYPELAAWVKDNILDPSLLGF